MQAEPMLGMVSTLLLMLAGLVYAFFGGRFIKLMLVVLGMSLGLAVGTAVASAVSPGNALATVLLGLACCVVGALLFGLLYKLAIYLVGFTLGALVGPLPVMAMGVDPQSGVGWLVVLLFAIIGGLLALMLEKQIMILFSAIVGAIFAVIHLRLLLADQYPVTPNEVGVAYEQTFTHMWWLVLLLIALGAWSQLKGRHPRQEP